MSLTRAFCVLTQKQRKQQQHLRSLLANQIRDSFYDLLELRQLEAGERYARQAAASASARQARHLKRSARGGGGGGGGSGSGSSSAAQHHYGATTAAVGRFGRWQGPTEAEQLAAVSHYAKYADYVPVLVQNTENGRGQDEEKACQGGKENQAGGGGGGGSSDMSRTSLLGRPLKIETHYRDLRYRKKQNIIYNFLERPRGWKAAVYHFLL